MTVQCTQADSESRIKDPYSAPRLFSLIPWCCTFRVRCSDTFWVVFRCFQLLQLLLVRVCFHIPVIIITIIIIIIIINVVIISFLVHSTLYPTDLPSPSLHYDDAVFTSLDAWAPRSITPFTIWQWGWRREHINQQREREQRVATTGHSITESCSRGQTEQRVATTGHTISESCSRRQTEQRVATTGHTITESCSRRQVLHSSAQHYLPAAVQMSQQRRKKNAITSRLKMSQSCDFRPLFIS